MREISQQGRDHLTGGDNGSTLLGARRASTDPVLAKLQEGGIEQTALHNHLLHESPHVMYMHIGGHGMPATLAAVHAGLALTGTPLGAAPATPPAPRCTR